MSLSQQETFNLLYKKRYTNYALGVLVYFGINILLAIVGMGSVALNTEALIIYGEDIFYPGVVILANLLFDYHWGWKIGSSPAWRRVTLKTMISLVAITVITLVGNEVEIGMGYPDDDYLSFGKNLSFDAYWTNVVTNIIFTLIIGIPAFFRESLLDEKKRNLLEEKSKVASLSKQLDVLKTELYSANVKPHFIFNALNGLLTLIHEEPNKAMDLVIHLSDFLRSSLYSSSKPDHSILQELKAMDDYLSIEKVRFGEKVKYQIEIDKAIKELSVPKFIILPLVENAIKHNANLDEIRIRVTVNKVENDIHILVTDNGEPFDKDLRFGDGLMSTKVMLQSHFSQGYALNFLSEPTKSVQLVLKQFATYA